MTPPISVDAAEGIADKFGSLQVALGDISVVYADHEVRSRPPAHLQETVIKNKIEDLSRIVALEARFETPPGDREAKLPGRVDAVVIAPPLEFTLSPFQQTLGHQGAIAVCESRVTTNCWSHSRRGGCARAS